MLTNYPTAGTNVVVVFDDDPDTPLIWRFETIILPGAEWERHLREHRPTLDGMDYNPATFPPAVIVASVVGWTVTRGDQTLEEEARAPTLDEAQELWESWPQWARMRLLRAIEVQNVTGLSFGKRARAHERQARARNRRYDLICTIAHHYRLPVSTVLGWDADDQLAAATSMSDELEACPGCGLRPDQFPHVNVALHHCPGCEARTRSSRELKKQDLGVRTVFETVADARDSVWAKLTSKGAVWARAHRGDPEGVQVADPDLMDG